MTAAPKPAVVSSARLFALTAAWLAVLIVCLAWIVRYKTKEGPQAAAPPTWPAQTSLPRTPGRNTVVMFVHPRCPCTRASLDELNLVMNDERARAGADVVVVFANLGTIGAPDAESAAWTAAGRIPNAVRLIDLDGQERTRFGAKTAGHVTLYDAAGQLRYSGGMTGSRGHAGDNVGRRTVRAWLQGALASAEHERPVYGCELDDPDDAAPRGSRP